MQMTDALPVLEAATFSVTMTTSSPPSPHAPTRTPPTQPPFCIPSPGSDLPALRETQITASFCQEDTAKDENEKAQHGAHSFPGFKGSDSPVVFLYPLQL